MSFLTITKGVTTIEVDVSADGGASEREPRRIGETVDVWSGGLSSSVSAEYREWEFPAAMMAAADYETLRDLVALDAVCTISGDAVGGVPYSVVIRVTSGPFVPDVASVGGFKRRAALSIRQAI